jgi:hypothetical protein
MQAWHFHLVSPENNPITPFAHPAISITGSGSTSQLRLPSKLGNQHRAHIRQTWPSRKQDCSSRLLARNDLHLGDNQ